MIHRVFGTLPGFKELVFRPGFNVLVADKTDMSTDRQTRNRAGKSSLLEVIHFALGANLEAESIFKNPRLAESEFGLEFDLNAQRVIAQRSGAEPNKVFVEAANTDDSPIRPKGGKQIGRYLSLADWRLLLGTEWFGLDELGTAGAEGNAPTFRSLLPYFVRRESNGGMREPVRQTEDQNEWNQQVSISYLLGLDWTLAQKFEHVRRQEKALKDLKKIAREGALGTFIPKSGELKTQLVLAEEQAEVVRRTLETFEVLAEYRDLEREASHLTLVLNGLADENTIDEQLISTMEAALQDEKPPAEADLERVYAEVRVTLPDAVRKRLEDVREFHRSIVSNRRSYLTSEMTPPSSAFRSVRLKNNVTICDVPR